MEYLKRLVRNYFGFSKSQTYGLLILIPLIFALLVLPNLYRDITQLEYDKFANDQIMLDSLVKEWNQNILEPSKSSEAKPEIQLVDFDPNQATVEELIGLGLAEFLAKRVVNYRNAGGRFQVKDDLKKIYGFPNTLFETIRPNILLPDELPKNDFTPRKPITEEKEVPTKPKSIVKEVEEPMFLIDVNTADSIEFRKLRGIGPAYSGRIVKFRALLGGFHSIDQVKDVFGISDSLYQSFEQHLTLSSNFTPSQININLASFKEINAHPYISYEQTKEIVNGKSKFGKYRSPADLQKLPLFDSLQIVKLTPYLKFQ